MARYVGGDPVDVEFGYKQDGNPYIKCQRYDLHFTLSHSGDLMVVRCVLISPAAWTSNGKIIGFI
ncbi:MAG TPA: hypothetical protein VIS96_10530 [Terrimicrobiaceae bacterium]